ncbi:hypothetical protein ABEB36_009258 [Hypothenemus hampei]|uniref:BED-type domain-containing protein n=1 Tax=Hypothenemus hampei TaxID=57062 RepID=A0ABD1EFT4_HYPHA
MSGKSEIWKYFKKEQEMVFSKLCPFKTRYNNNTSNLWNHFRSKHGSRNVFEENNGDAIEIKKTSSTNANLSNYPQHSQAKIDESFFSNKLSEQRQEQITQLITNMICLDTLPISFIEGKGFKKLY